MPEINIVENFIILNRSFAENNPSLLYGKGCEQLDYMFSVLSELEFCNYVWTILDANE